MPSSDLFPKRLSMQEILGLIAIALALLYIPRLRGGKAAARDVSRETSDLPPLTGWMRLAILLTFLWISGFALFMKPWQTDPLPYLMAGLAPPLVFWGALWVFYGYRKYRR
jgi:hypothetical protein